MPIQNKEVARILAEVADLLDLKGESSFRVRSYRNAARAISGFTENITMMDEEKIKTLPGIGESMLGKIREINATGHLLQLDELHRQIPIGLIEVMKLEQLGPHRTKTLYENLKIESIEDLKKVAEEGKVEKLKGFGKKTTNNILREINEYSQKGGMKRFKLDDASFDIEPLTKHLSEKIQDLKVAGSYRRGLETVGDIDILGTSENPAEAMRHFVEYENVDRIISRGETRSSVKLRSGLQADLRIVKKESLGAALLYFTGSKAHGIALRRLAIEKDYKLNEYGLFEKEKVVASKTEEDIYQMLDLPYIEPELREDNGEVEAAKAGKLPRLISLEDIRGDLHSHTTATDGKYTIEQMAVAAKEKGYEYLAISDHSKRVAMAHGLDAKRLEEQIIQIEELNNKSGDFTIVKSIEVDILEDGTLDLPDSILKELDIVICSVHYNRNLSREKQTRRILRAMENPNCNIIAHPTGRMLGKRNEFQIDMPVIMKEARDMGCFLEINSNPDRLDLNDQYIRQAREIGLKLAISTDAHTTASFENIKYGIAQARRGWLSKNDVINTRPWKQLKKLLVR